MLEKLAQDTATRAVQRDDVLRAATAAEEDAKTGKVPNKSSSTTGDHPAPTKNVDPAIFVAASRAALLKARDESQKASTEEKAS